MLQQRAGTRNIGKSMAYSSDGSIGLALRLSGRMYFPHGFKLPNWRSLKQTILAGYGFLLLHISQLYPINGHYTTRTDDKLLADRADERQQRAGAPHDLGSKC